MFCCHGMLLPIIFAIRSSFVYVHVDIRPVGVSILQSSLRIWFRVGHVVCRRRQRRCHVFGVRCRLCVVIGARVGISDPTFSEDNIAVVFVIVSAAASLQTLLLSQVYVLPLCPIIRPMRLTNIVCVRSFCVLCLCVSCVCVRLRVFLVCVLGLVVVIEYVDMEHADATLVLNSNDVATCSFATMRMVAAEHCFICWACKFASGSRLRVLFAPWRWVALFAVQQPVVWHIWAFFWNPSFFLLNMTWRVYNPTWFEIVWGGVRYVRVLIFKHGL